MEEMKFKSKSKRYHFSSEMYEETVTGLDKALTVYSEKCKDYEVVIMEKSNGGKIWETIKSQDVIVKHFLKPCVASIGELQEQLQIMAN